MKYHKSWTQVTGSLVLIVMMGLWSVTVRSVAGQATEPRSLINFDQLPLYFIENQGQIDAQVGYYIQGRDKTVYFGTDGVTFSLLDDAQDSQRKRIFFDGRLYGFSAVKPGLLERAKLQSAFLPQRQTLPLYQRYNLKLRFLHANPVVKPVGRMPYDTVFSYFKGKPEDWQVGLSTYAQIVYSDLWPGIDLVFHGDQNKLKYEFVVKPGADPGQIQLAYEGATSLTIDNDGQLMIETPVGTLHDERPFAYQEVAGEQMSVAMDYVIKNGTQDEAPNIRYHFKIGDYNPALPLTLDPAVVVYAGFIGGSGADGGVGLSVDRTGIAVDSAGNAYITGSTDSSEASFLVHSGPDLTFNGTSDAFVAKVKADGTGLLYAGFIGGSGNDGGQGIAVDSMGNAYVTGFTSSSEASFPVRGGPDLTFNGVYDAFVAKVKADGTGLLYAGYIGGNGGTAVAFGDDYGHGITVDSAGNAYVTGRAGSSETSFPVYGGPDLTYNNGDAFVAKVNVDGTGLVYAGYIGGNGGDTGEGIAIDSAGSAYVTGGTSSNETSFPVRGGPDLTYNDDNRPQLGDADAFVAKVKADGTELVYAGYIGGNGYDKGNGIAVDSAGSAYVTGSAASSEASFPVRGGPDLTYNGGNDGPFSVGDAFVAKVKADGTELVYAGYIGGNGNDAGQGIAIDSAGSAYVTGGTSSNETSFPVRSGPDLTYNGGNDGPLSLGDAFVAKVKADGTELVYAGYIGGNGNDKGNGIAVDSAGNAHVTGYTLSTETSFPASSGPDLTSNGDYDSFVAKISENVGNKIFLPIIFNHSGVENKPK